jgi:hypothetical protein
MFQAIHPAKQCKECRNEIPQEWEFNCGHCSTTLCDGCLLDHEDDCRESRAPVKFRLRVFQVYSVTRAWALKQPFTKEP